MRTLPNVGAAPRRPEPRMLEHTYLVIVPASFLLGS